MIKEYLIKRKEYVLYGLLCFVFLIFLLGYMGMDSFWLDELYEVSFLHKSKNFGELMNLYTTLSDAAPPMFSMIAYFWYQIVPRTDKWLLLLPTMMTVLGLYITGITARRVKGKRFGFWVILLGACSSILATTCAFEFRQYGLVFLVSATLLYVYVRRYQQNQYGNIGMIVTYAIFLALMPFSHYVAIIIDGAFFLSDVWLFAKKKISFKFVIPYFLAAAMFLPWIIIVFLNKVTDVTSFWPAIPNMSAVYGLIVYLFNNTEFSYVIGVIGVVIILGGAYELITRKRFDYNKNYLPLVLCWIPLCMFAGIIVYSKYIMPSGSMFVDRYFLCLLPYLFCIMAYVPETIVTLSKKINSERVSQKTTLFALILMTVMTIGFSSASRTCAVVSTSHEAFKEAGEWLLAKSDIKDDDTILISSNDDYIVYAWEEHYITKYGKRKGFKVLSSDQKDITLEGLKSNKWKKIYTTSFNQELEPAIKKELADNYDLVEDVTEYKLQVYERRED